MSTIVRYISSKYNIIMFNYLKDILILAEDFQQCESHIKKVIENLENLDWCIIFKNLNNYPCAINRVFGSVKWPGNKNNEALTKNIKKCMEFTNSNSNLLKCDLKFLPIQVQVLKNWWDHFISVPSTPPMVDYTLKFYIDIRVL